MRRQTLPCRFCPYPKDARVHESDVDPRHGGHAFEALERRNPDEPELARLADELGEARIKLAAWERTTSDGFLIACLLGDRENQYRRIAELEAELARGRAPETPEQADTSQAEARTREERKP